VEESLNKSVIGNEVEESLNKSVIGNEVKILFRLSVNVKSTYQNPSTYQPIPETI